MSNFSLFKDEWEVLAKLWVSTERNLYNDSHTSIIKLRLLAESIAKAILASDNIGELYGTKQIERSTKVPVVYIPPN